MLFNLARKRFWRGLIMGFCLTTSLSFASGLDLLDSTVTISYNDEGRAGVPAFSCFGQSTSPVILTFQALNLDTDWSRQIDDCFQQAGIYTVSVHLEDEAGNAADQEFTIRVKPGRVDFTNTVQNDRRDPNSMQGPTANNQDYYEFTFLLKDALGNPIDQITGGRISSVTTFEDDANLGVSFRDGLRLNDGSPLPTSEPTTDNVADSDLSDGINFQLKAIAPSLVNLGAIFGGVADRELVLRFSFVDIEPDGSVSPTDTQPPIFPTKTVRFHPLFHFVPTLQEDIRDGQPVMISIDISTFGFVDGLTPARPDSVRIYSPSPINFETPDISGSEGEFSSGYEFSGDITPQSGPIAGVQTGIMPTLNGILGDHLEVYTEVEYLLDGETIRHVAGVASTEYLPPDCTPGDPDCDPCAEGNPDPCPCDQEEINCTQTAIDPPGTDFESPVVANPDRGVLGDRVSVFYDILGQANLVRDQMRLQAFNLMAGLTSQVCPVGTGFIIFDDGTENDLESVFSDQDVVLVEDCNIEMKKASGISLPQGQKTLVIRNGNLRIESDLAYQNLEDSFGIMLINDQSEAYPATGNIFIKETIQHLRGTYFAEGAIFSFEGGTVPNNFNPITDNTYITNKDDHDRQLVLLGAMLTYNTVGGRLQRDDYLDAEAEGDAEAYGEEPFYFTPWHTFTDDSTTAQHESADIVSGIATENQMQDLATKYDLHFVREYRSSEATDPDTGEPWKCAQKVGSTPECDLNTNAFVIRNDQRAVNFPPPGFTLLEAVDLGQ